MIKYPLGNQGDRNIKGHTKNCKRKVIKVTRKFLNNELYPLLRINGYIIEILNNREEKEDFSAPLLVSILELGFGHIKIFNCIT